VMPVDPMPFISLGIVVPTGAVYDSHQWRTETGQVRASVRFEAGGHANAHLQGPPAALRELAAALVQAAALAGHADQPTAAVLAEGVAG
jgi:hypothetical protein